MNSIFVGDNLSLLNTIKNKNLKFDLVLTDPPYNLNKNFGNQSDSNTEQEFLNQIEERIKLISEILTNNGSLILFASHLYVAQLNIMIRKYLNYQRMMIWYYQNGMSRQSNSPVTEYEPFLWFTKSNTYTYNADDIRLPYKSERVKNPVYKTDKNGNKKAWLPNPLGAKRGDVWKYPTLSGKVYEDEKTEHPTQKPQSLITDILKAFVPKDIDGKYSGIVLDPYMGSGTTAVCCEMLNRSGNKIKWLGAELEQRWADTANDRLRAISSDYCL